MANTQPSAGALAEQRHVIDEAEHPETAAAFERLAAQYAPGVTWDALHAHEVQIVDAWMARTAPCIPMTLYAGPFDCLDRECDEYATEDDEPTGIDHCSHISRQQVCETHSEFYDGELCTRAEPWPCQAASRGTTGDDQ